MKSILTSPRLARANRNLEAHGIDMTTPSQTARHPMESMGIGKFQGEVKTRTSGVKLDTYKTKTRKGDPNVDIGEEYKVIGSMRKVPGVSYETGWHTSEQSARNRVGDIMREAKAKQK